MFFTIFFLCSRKWVDSRVGQWAGWAGLSPAQPIPMGQTLFSTNFLPTQLSPFVILSGNSAHFEPMIFLNNSLDIQKFRKATFDTVVHTVYKTNRLQCKRIPRGPSHGLIFYKKWVWAQPSPSVSRPSPRASSLSQHTAQPWCNRVGRSKNLQNMLALA